jgi:antitoxin component HigA of HigAB toxin-antitoxin module
LNNFRRDYEYIAKHAALPKSHPITNEAEYEAAFRIIDTYFARMGGDESKISDAEHDHFEVVARAIQAYEKEHYPSPTRQTVLMRGFSVGEWDAQSVRVFRKKFDLTQANLAEFLGVKQSRIAEIESGNHTLSTTTRIALDRVQEHIRQALEG